MKIEKCWYCSSNIYPGHGVVFVRNDAKIFRFCRSKCHKHFKAKHQPHKSKWTKAYRKAAGKELLVDTVLSFEKQRNRPVRYDRTLVVKTVQAMKKVQEIKEARNQRHYVRRMEKTHARQSSLAKAEILRHEALKHQEDLLDKSKVKNEIKCSDVDVEMDDTICEKRKELLEEELSKKVKQIPVSKLVMRTEF